MSLGNLTQVEAQHRAEILHVHAYDIELDLTTGEASFGSRSTVRFDCSAPGTGTFLDLLATSVEGVTLNGRDLDPAEVFRDGRVYLDDVAATNTVTVMATCPYTHDGEGMHRAVDPADDEVYLYTQFESAHARQVYACFEQPDLKATFEISVIAPRRWEVVSNMPTPTPTPADGDNARWSFAATPLLPTYLTVLVAGPYHMVRDEHRMTLPDGSEVTIPLALGCRQSLAKHLDSDEFLQITKDGLDFIVSRFGHPYPFAKYDQMLIPEYGGAMENPGAVTFADSSFIFRQVVTDAEREMRAYVILHEMAHMWFGDLVTMRWWNDIWLNEAFATYVGALAVAESSRFSNAWATFIGQFKSGAMAADQMPTTHPIVGEIVDLDAVQSAFDAITYRKGASVLRQLAAWVGSENFAGGVHDYFAAHAWGNATATDFLDALATASGRDLGAWADEWLHRTGINTLSADFTVDADGVFTSFAVVQSGEPLRSHRIAIGSYGFDDAGALTRSGRIELDVVGARTEVPAMVGQPRPDLLLLNDDDLTYTKINLDDASLATIVASAGAITDPLARALVWSIAWDMCRDARMSAADYVAMVRSGVDRESLLTTRRTLIGQSVHAILRYADPDWISTGLAEVASHARSRLAGVSQTDDSRLIWLNALVEAARDSDDFDFLTALLDGSATVDGIEVGGDLRWRLIIALAAAGRLDAAGIDAQLANDTTTSGTEDAAEARAAIPTASAKAAAWKLIVDDAQPTPIRIYTAKGFAHEGQAELRSGYVDEYFELAPTFFAGSARLGRSLIALLYPSEEISTEALARTDAYLDRTDLDPSLRRMLVEGRDSVARALRARQAVAPTT